MKEILIVEDNPEIKILVESTLDGFELTVCSTLKEATEALKKKKFDLLLLDLELPDGDGLKFLTEFAPTLELSHVPVIILSGKSETANKVMAFSIGAEDFISKPFDPLELKARVAAKLRKVESQQMKSDLLKAGDLHINIPKHLVSIHTPNGLEKVDLTTLEFKLLLTLARAPERVFTREFLLTEVWGSDISITDRTVDTHIGHLRKKILHSKVKIDTVIGSGYRLILS